MEEGKKIKKITEGRREENKKDYRWEVGKKIRKIIDGNLVKKEKKKDYRWESSKKEKSRKITDGSRK